MRRAQTLADWLLLVGAVALFVSLFLSWSHQLPSAGLAASVAIRGVPADATAWQVYSVADVLLALLAGTLAVLALRGRARGARVTALVVVGVALGFALHADSHAPTNGLYLPSLGSFGRGAAGPGETVAIIALALAAAGLVLSLALDLSSNRVSSRHR